MKKIILGVLGGLLLLSAVVVVRTTRLVSQPIETEPATLVEVDAQAAAERLAASLRFETVSHQNPEEFRGEEFRKLHAYLEEAFPRVHTALSKEVVSDYSLLYTWKGTEANLKPALLMGHLDVVPIEPGTEESWSYPPFGGRIAEGYVWGRGAMDDKVGVLGIFEAVETLLAAGFEPRRTVLLAFGHDEEVTQTGAQALVALLESRGVELEFVLDEGGGISEGAFPGIEKSVATIGISEKGYLSLELAVEVSGGHSSVPPPQSAVGILSAAISKLEQNPFPTRLSGPVRQMYETLAPEMPFSQRMLFANLWLFSGRVEAQLAASPSTAAGVRTTTAATMFGAGVKENVLPSKARAVVNFRILPGESIKSVTQRVRATIADPRVQLTELVGAGEPSPVSSTEAAPYKMLGKTIRQIYPEVLISPYLVLGYTDSSFYTKLSPNVYRFHPGMEGPDDLKRFHGTDERTGVEDYKKQIQFFAQVLRNSVE